MVLIDQRSSESPFAAERDGASAQRAARRTLRDQIARLEGELAEAILVAFPHVRVQDAIASARGSAEFPHVAAPPAPALAAGPRVLDLGQLERVRDALAEQVRVARAAAADRAAHEARSRALLQEMLREPQRYKFVRLRAADLGERSCGAYHVRPRLGVVGMLMGWWHVKVSSGCPLPTPA